jgi:hypothetical protein
MLLRRASTLAALGTAVLVTARASASASAHLVYVRDPTAAACPDEGSLRQAVKQRVGYDPFFPWAKTLVVVEVTGEEQSFVAQLRLVDETGLSRGVRELRSGASGCRGLIDATALAISIALEMNAFESPEPAPTSSPEPPPPPAPTPVPPSAPSPLPGAAEPADVDHVLTPPSNALRAVMGVDAVAAIGAAPVVSPGMDLWVAARWAVASLGLDVQGDTPSASVRGEGGGQARVLFFAATIAPCAEAGPAFACALGSLGWLHATGADLAHPASGAAFVPAAGLRTGLQVAIARSLTLRVRGDVLANLALPSVSLNGATAWTLPQVSGVVGVGLAHRFP